MLDFYPSEQTILKEIGKIIKLNELEYFIEDRLKRSILKMNPIIFYNIKTSKFDYLPFWVIKNNRCWDYTELFMAERLEGDLLKHIYESIYFISKQFMINDYISNINGRAFCLTIFEKDFIFVLESKKLFERSLNEFIYISDISGFPRPGDKGYQDPGLVSFARHLKSLKSDYY